MTTLNGDTTTPSLITATPLIEKGLLRGEKTNEVCLPLTSTVVLKREQEMLYVPVDFENNPTVDAMVDSRALVSATARMTWTQYNGKPQRILSKSTNLPMFRYK